jgi:acyl-CoA reductase-like NAD-dependent aldehyde dehydrogenase
VVQRAVHGEVVRRLAGERRAVTVGPWQQEIRMGRLISARQHRRVLVASVWTSGLGRAIRMSRGLRAGQVAVNAALGAGVIGGPFGGYERSGFGRTVGADAVLEHPQVKAVSFRGAA